MAERGSAPQEAVDEYSRLRPQYERFTDRLADLLTQLVKTAEIEYVQVERRAKTIDSFRAKLARKGEKYANPLEDVTDLAGIRIITYYREDVDEVERLIRKQFNVDDTRSVDKSHELDPDRFGYASVHLIVSLDDSRSSLPEWADVTGLTAEIQVRTATQHAWAALQHKLQYKSEDVTPREISRRLYRLSALFELADEQFTEVERVTRAEGQKHDVRMRMGDLDAALDITSLRAYLDASPTVKDVLRVAVEAGWTVREEPDPSDPDRRDRDLRDLVRSLHSLDVKRVSDFDDLMQQAEEAADRLAVVRTREANEPFGGGHTGGKAFAEDILNIMVLLLSDAPPELVQEIYGGVTADAINEAIRGSISV